MFSLYKNVCQLAVLLLCVTNIGCKDTSDKALLASSNQSNVQRLANLYHMYQSQHKWIGPPSTEKFKEWVQGVETDRLEMMGIDPGDIPALFLSERDGKELLFRFKIKGSAMGSIAPVVFEQTGVDGTRMVGFTAMRPKEVSDQTEYDDLMSGKFSPPKSSRTNTPVGPPPTGS